MNNSTVFYFSKSISINTKYSGLLETFGMMVLNTKGHIKSSPRYLFSDIVLHNTQSSSHHYLRSQVDHTRLHIPKTHRPTGDKAFFVIGPHLWNMLPITTREAASLAVFKKLLKTYLFSHSI